MREKAAVQVEIVEARLTERERMRGALRGLVDARPGHGPLGTCPIRAALTTDSVGNDAANRSARA